MTTDETITMTENNTNESIITDEITGKCTIPGSSPTNNCQADGTVTNPNSNKKVNDSKRIGEELFLLNCPKKRRRLSLLETGRGTSCPKNNATSSTSTEVSKSATTYETNTSISSANIDSSVNNDCIVRKESLLNVGFGGKNFLQFDTTSPTSQDDTFEHFRPSSKTVQEHFKKPNMIFFDDELDQGLEKEIQRLENLETGSLVKPKTAEKAWQVEARDFETVNSHTGVFSANNNSMDTSYAKNTEISISSDENTCIKEAVGCPVTPYGTRKSLIVDDIVNQEVSTPKMQDEEDHNVNLKKYGILQGQTAPDEMGTNSTCNEKNLSRQCTETEIAVSKQCPDNNNSRPKQCLEMKKTLRIYMPTDETMTMTENNTNEIISKEGFITDKNTGKCTIPDGSPTNICQADQTIIKPNLNRRVESSKRTGEEFFILNCPEKQRRVSLFETGNASCSKNNTTSCTSTEALKCNFISSKKPSNNNPKSAKTYKTITSANIDSLENNDCNVRKESLLNVGFGGNDVLQIDTTSPTSQDYTFEHFCSSSKTVQEHFKKHNMTFVDDELDQALDKEIQRVECLEKAWQMGARNFKTLNSIASVLSRDINSMDTSYPQNLAMSNSSDEMLNNGFGGNDVLQIDTTSPTSQDYTFEHFCSSSKTVQEHFKKHNMIFVDDELDQALDKEIQRVESLEKAWQMGARNFKTLNAHASVLSRNINFMDTSCPQNLVMSNSSDENTSVKEALDACSPVSPHNKRNTPNLDDFTMLTIEVPTPKMQDEEDRKQPAPPED